MPRMAVRATTKSVIGILMSPTQMDFILWLLSFQDTAYFGQSRIGILPELDISRESRAFGLGWRAPGAPLRRTRRWFSGLFPKGKAVAGHENTRTNHRNSDDISDYF